MKKTFFGRAHSENQPTIEFLLKNLSDMAKRSAEYRPEAMEPFINTFVHLMRFDVEKKTIYLKRIFEYIRPVIVKAVQLDRGEAVKSFLEQLSELERSIRDSQNFRAAKIYVSTLRETFQDLLRYEMKERDRLIWEIFSMMERVFLDLLESNLIGVREKDQMRLEALLSIIEESQNVGYNLIVKNELYFFDKYLEMLERMYLGLNNTGKTIRGNLEKEFFHSLFGLGILALNNNNREFVAKILSRGEIDQFRIDVDKKLHEDFAGKYQPEECVEWALGNPFSIFRSGMPAREREIIQFYLLIRSMGFYRQVRKNNPAIWNYPSSKLRGFLKQNSRWIFFEEKIPEKFSQNWTKVSLVSDFTKRIENLNINRTEVRGCTDFPDYMRISKRFEKGNYQLQKAVESFTDGETISREAFGGALTQFLKITVYFLERINDVWEREKERIERTFPIDQEREEMAMRMIGEGLEIESVFREAVEWKRTDQGLPEADVVLDETLFKKPVRAILLKDLPILVSTFFHDFGRNVAWREDKDILDGISGRNIREEKTSLAINVTTIRGFLERFECEELILITGRDVHGDFRNSGEIQYLREINKAYEVTVDENRKAFIYQSNLFGNKTLIFARDKFLQILYFEEKAIRIRFPRENELSEGEVKEDFRMIVISQNRGLRFLDLAKAIIIEHETLPDSSF